MIRHCQWVIKVLAIFYYRAYGRTLNLFGTGETMQLRELNTKTERVAKGLENSLLFRSWFLLPLANRGELFVSMKIPRL